MLMIQSGQLAVGVCGIEERLNSQIKKMLEQIEIIDECDTLGQNLDAGVAIHLVLPQIQPSLESLSVINIDFPFLGTGGGLQGSFGFLSCRHSGT